MLSLSGRKKIIVIVAFMLLCLTACAAFELAHQEGESVSGLYEAIIDGILLQIEEEIVMETQHRITRVQVMDMTATIEMRANIFFPNTKWLTFERTEGYVVIHVLEGDYVRKGDLLATLSFEDDEFIIDSRRAELRLEQFDRNSSREEQRLLTELEIARYNLDSAPEYEWEHMTLALAQAELNLEVFLVDRNNQRSALTEALANIRETIAGEQLLAPFDGLVQRTIRDGSFVSGHVQIITIVEQASFLFSIQPNGQSIRALPPQIPRNGLLRFGDVLNIRSVAEYAIDDVSRPLLEFKAQVAIDPITAGFHSGTSSVIVPVDRQAFIETAAAQDITLSQLRNMDFITYITLDIASNSYVLPNAAIRPEDTRYYVFKYIDGNLAKRYVVPGIRQSGYTQIISGLEADSQVVILP